MSAATLLRVYRGGAFDDAVANTRSATRDVGPAGTRTGTLGVRPARAITR